MTSRIYILALLAALTSTIEAFAQETEDYYNTRWLPREGWKNNDWMKKISDDTPLGQITIPGTHDSGSRTPLDFSQNQTWMIDDQLRVGIRYIDIRPRAMKYGGMHIYHGPIPQFHSLSNPRDLTLNDVFTWCKDFLTENPSECIIMRIRQEQDPEDGAESFQTLFNKVTNDKANAKFWYTESGKAVPTLGKVRGKIVLVTTENGIGGIHLNRTDVSWFDDYHVPTIFYRWQHTIDAEWHAYSASGAFGNKKSLYLTGMNGTSAGCYPYTTAYYANYYLHYSLNFGSYCSNHPDLRGRQVLGIVAMDFPGEGLIQNLLQTNFK